MYAETLHYKNDRRKREDFFIKNFPHGELLIEVEEPTRLEGKPNAIIKIYSNGLGCICEKGTDKIITKKCLRPNQLRKYFALINQTVPSDLMELAIYNKRMHYNEI